MTWILFVWLTVNGQPVSLHTQELSSRKSCVQVARSLQANLGSNMGFLCLEKGGLKK